MMSRAILRANDAICERCAMHFEQFNGAFYRYLKRRRATKSGKFEILSPIQKKPQLSLLDFAESYDGELFFAKTRAVTNEQYNTFKLSAADVKMEIPVLVRSLKSSIFCSTSLQMGKTFWGVVSAAVEQSRRKANMVAQGDGKFGPWGWPQDPSKPKKTTFNWVLPSSLCLFQEYFLDSSNFLCVISGFLRYFHLATFFWMFVEGKNFQ